ncbi:MAG: cbb3-type cytochrome c oxidase subunit II [Verrucomicrobiota bacterium]
MLAFSFTGLILSSQIQFGDLKPIALEEGEMPMPQARVGLAQQGKEIYIDQGCIYCHSQQVRRKGFGADWERGWGDRQSVPRDYILQERVLLGTSRTGPDLMAIGDRQPSADWHHLHLFNPQITSPGSIMPPFRYLYRTQKIGDAPSPNALNIPDDFPLDQPEPGYEIVPTDRADQLVEYLLSLKLDYELPESRFAE